MQRVNEIENMARIRVIGVGGGGNNAINRMLLEAMPGIDFIAVNTDAQALLQSNAPTRLQVGDKSTRGLGSGGDPSKGEMAAKESMSMLEQTLVDSDMVFVTAGMGGGTGTGAAPIVAKVAKAAGALTIGVVTRPFMFEGSRRSRLAEEGIAKLKENVDTLIVIPNDRLLELSDRRMTLMESFSLADEVLLQAIQGISQLITVPGLINLDFADVKAVMSEGGAALMALGIGQGDDKATIAAREALNNSLLDVTIDGARGILFNITGGSDMTLQEINEAASIIRETAHPDANMIFGAVIDEALEDEIRVTVIATGFARDTERREVAGILRPVESAPEPLRITLDEQEDVPVEALVEEPAGTLPRKPELVTTGARPSERMSQEVAQLRERVRFSPDNLDIPTFLRRTIAN